MKLLNCKNKGRNEKAAQQIISSGYSILKEAEKLEMLYLGKTLNAKEGLIMKRIGILAVRTLNYGSLLQSYATQEVVKRYGI